MVGLNQIADIDTYARDRKKCNSMRPIFFDLFFTILLTSCICLLPDVFLVDSDVFQYKLQNGSTGSTAMIS